MRPKSEIGGPVLAHNIRTVRQGLGMTQEKLANQAGIPVKTVQRIERGERVSSESLECIAGALRVPGHILQLEQKAREAALAEFNRTHTSLELNRIERVTQFAPLVECDAMSLDLAPGGHDSHARAAADLHQDLTNLQNLWRVISPLERHECLLALQPHLDRFAGLGLAVTATTTKGSWTTLAGQRSPLTYAVIVVSSAKHPARWACIPKNQPVR